MFDIGIVLQIVGILVALASIEQTLIGKSYGEVRSAYLATYRRVLTEIRQLERQDIVIPETKMVPFIFKFSGIRQVLFGIALNPRRRFLVIFSYLFNIVLDLSPFGFFILLIFSKQIDTPSWLLTLTGFISITWLLGTVMNIRSRWKLERDTKSNRTQRALKSIFRTFSASVVRPVRNSWKAFLLTIDFAGMLPALFVPSRLLPLRTSNERRRYLLNVGSVYIVIGLLLQLFFK